MRQGALKTKNTSIPIQDRRRPRTLSFGLLIAQLQSPDGMLEARDAQRGLVDRIALQPRPEGGKLDIHQGGALAALLMLSLEPNTETA